MPIIPVGNETLWDQGKLSERIQGSSPGSISISLEGDSRATMVYIVEGPKDGKDQRNPLVLFCQEVLGSVSINAANGALKRVSPMAHPQFRWLYAERITSIKGLGFARESASDPASPLLRWYTFGGTSWQTIQPYYLIYDRYEVTVEFSSRPYITADDATMQKLNAAYPNSYTISGEQAKYYNDKGEQKTVVGDPFREYARFITYTTETSAEFLTMKGGAFKFVSDVDQINSQSIPGFYGKTLIPKVVLKMTWSIVPYAFIDPSEDASTNIFQALGRVNQNWFFGYGPGELLFTGFTNSQKMKNQFDVFAYSIDQVADLPRINDILYTDIVLSFLYIPIYSYSKTNTIYPSSPKGIINPSNLSYVNAGHNLAQTQVNKQYYPVVSADVEDPAPVAARKKRPIYGSYPFELIFNAKPYRMALESVE